MSRFTDRLLEIIDAIPDGVGRRTWRVMTIFGWFVLTGVFVSQVELNGFDELFIIWIIAGVITGAVSVAISYVFTNKVW